MINQLEICHLMLGCSMKWEKEGERPAVVLMRFVHRRLSGGGVCERNLLYV